MPRRTKTGRPRVEPMPIDLLYDHPAALALPSAGFGGLCRLVIHFWISECRPLPIQDHELCHIARMHVPTWRTHKTSILTIFGDLQPLLEAHKAHTDRFRLALANAAHASNSQRRMTLLAKVSRSAPPSPAMPFQPQRDPPKAPRPAPPDQRPQRLMVDR